MLTIDMAVVPEAATAHEPRRIALSALLRELHCPSWLLPYAVALDDLARDSDAELSVTDSELGQVLGPRSGADAQPASLARRVARARGEWQAWQLVWAVDWIEATPGGFRDGRGEASGYVVRLGLAVDEVLARAGSDDSGAIQAAAMAFAREVRERARRGRQSVTPCTVGNPMHRERLGGLAAGAAGIRSALSANVGADNSKPRGREPGRRERSTGTRPAVSRDPGPGVE